MMFEAFMELAKCAGNIGVVTNAAFSEKMIAFDVVNDEGNTLHLSLFPEALKGGNDADS